VSQLSKNAFNLSTKLLSKKLFALRSLSIKNLTLLGFTLVALPLVFALLYSVNQVDKLSKQGASSIFKVAELINANRELTTTLKKLERYASQYVVLKDEELFNSYLKHKKIMTTLLTQELTYISASKLPKFSKELLTEIKKIDLLIQNNTADMNDEELLIKLQKQFRQLTTINRKIQQHSNALINVQANKIKGSAEHVSNTIIKSLFIIPISLFIAVIFMILITAPLKLLTQKIKKLEQGNFDDKISLKGASDIVEIADALETMRGRLHALELQKSSFIRHISHELKTPLAAIREGTELLYDHSVGELNSDQQEISHIIKGSVTRLQRLIEDLLDFNIVLDQTSLQYDEKFTLNTVVNDVIATRKLDLNRKKLQVIKQITQFNKSVSSDFSAIKLHCNAKQLTVVLDNLLSNAIKFAPQNSKIIFDVNTFEGELLFTITDFGSGISKDQQNKIFDAFYQGTQPQDKQIKGSGLGLTIVKELLMRLNGSISITSQTCHPSYTRAELKLSSACTEQLSSSLNKEL
jgi:two-component system sensor histidine kinase GlrK